LPATHKTDRNDARGLAHLARTGFFKPVHAKSLPAHAIRALIIARKKLVGQRVTLGARPPTRCLLLSSFALRLPSARGGLAMTEVGTRYKPPLDNSGQKLDSAALDLPPSPWASCARCTLLLSFA
jgi:hypothetical protein